MALLAEISTPISIAHSVPAPLPLTQCTIKNSVKATGVALHGGQQVTLTLHPAPANTGIIFRRTDINPIVELPAHPNYIGDTTLQTTLVKENVQIATVEHVLSACAGLGIDNLRIDVTSAEVPVMDGSAAPFVFLIQSAGIQELTALKRFIRIKKTLHVEEGDKWLTVEPFDGFKVSFTIQFEHPLFRDGAQHISLDFSAASYIQSVSRARTFGFLSDFEKLKNMHLARGGSLKNAVVVDEKRVLNEEGLRYQDEFVKHKVLDVIGDLYLLGGNIIGHVIGHKSGHTLNKRLAQMLLENPDTWEYAAYNDAAKAPLAYQWAWLQRREDAS